jgi:hypothetical protein
MRIVQRSGRTRPPAPERPGRFELRPNGELRKPSTRRPKERRYPWVMQDNWNHKIVGYFHSKRCADRALREMRS